MMGPGLAEVVNRPGMPGGEKKSPELGAVAATLSLPLLANVEAARNGRFEQSLHELMRALAEPGAAPGVGREKHPVREGRLVRAEPRRTGQLVDRGEALRAKRRREENNQPNGLPKTMAGGAGGAERPSPPGAATEGGRSTGRSPQLANSTPGADNAAAKDSANAGGTSESAGGRDAQDKKGVASDAAGPDKAKGSGAGEGNGKQIEKAGLTDATSPDPPGPEKLAPDPQGLRASEESGGDTRVSQAPNGGAQVGNAQGTGGGAAEQVTAAQSAAASASGSREAKEGGNLPPSPTGETAAGVDPVPARGEGGPGSTQGGLQQGTTSGGHEGTSRMPPAGSPPDGGGTAARAAQPAHLGRFTEAMDMARLRGGGDMTVRIETETLGEMQLKVSVAHRAVQATIVTDHEEARSLLVAQQGALQAALARHNLRFEGLSLGTGGGEQAQHSGSDHQGAMGSREREANQPALSARPAGRKGASSGRRPPVPAHTGGLSILV